VRWPPDNFGLRFGEGGRETDTVITMPRGQGKKHFAIKRKKGWIATDKKLAGGTFRQGKAGAFSRKRGAQNERKKRGRGVTVGAERSSAWGGGGEEGDRSARPIY